jgi:hypothetical protein
VLNVKEKSIFEPASIRCSMRSGIESQSSVSEVFVHLKTSTRLILFLMSIQLSRVNHPGRRKWSR